jgi:hypothetical protein
MDILKKLLSNKSDNKPHNPDSILKKPSKTLWTSKDFSDIGEKVKKILKGDTHD